ncbi:MAG: glycosyltransferase family 4 protein [Chloroflexota bacterium]
MDSAHGSSSMRILILTHHYPPEVGAPQTRLSGTARFLRERGHDVAVVTAMPSYPTGVIAPAYRRTPRRTEWIDGIRVERTWTYARPGGSIRLRLANQLSFTASALAALPAVGPRDVVLVESPPLFLGMTGAIFSATLRAPMVLHVSDLWPAVPIELGALRNPLAIQAARLFERAAYAASTRLILVTERWRDQLVEQGVPAEKIDLVTNGVDARFLDPEAEESRAAREAVRAELGLAEKTVVACIGTVSYVYGYETILEAAGLLASDRSIQFLVVGDGSQKQAVQEIVTSRRLTNVTLLPAQPHGRIRGLLAASDLSASALLPMPVTRGQLPVRVLEALSMGLPVTFSGEGVAARLVAESGGGVAVPPDDASALADAIRALASDAARRQQLGRAGRATILERFDRRLVAAKIEVSLLRAIGR